MYRDGTPESLLTIGAVMVMVIVTSGGMMVKDGILAIPRFMKLIPPKRK